ncbi:MAG: hypothetical protein ACJATN_002739 [Neolewinella sp.]|jgi:hypothetical protein
MMNIAYEYYGPDKVQRCITNTFQGAAAGAKRGLKGMVGRL